jgi:hypothetical protein
MDVTEVCYIEWTDDHQNVSSVDHLSKHSNFSSSLTDRSTGGTQKNVPTMLCFFSSGAHVWVPGAKTTGLIVKKFGFSSI